MLVTSFFYFMATKKREMEVHKGDRFLNPGFLLKNLGHFLITFLVKVLRKLKYYMVVIEVMRYRLLMYMKAWRLSLGAA